MQVSLGGWIYVRVWLCLWCARRVGLMEWVGDVVEWNRNLWCDGANLRQLLSHFVAYVANSYTSLHKEDINNLFCRGSVVQVDLEGLVRCHSGPVKDSHAISIGS